MILIIGCGYLGCHTGRLLKEKGIEFHMIDKEDDFFCGSSSKNQNRLHLGFHYPRSYRTRQESKDGYHYFIKHYGNLCKEIKNNIYVVSKTSLIDLQTYKNIFLYENIDFQDFDISDLNKYNLDFNPNLIEGCIKCDEKLIDNISAKRYFKNLLGSHLIPFNQDININKNYKYIINCTYGHLKFSSEEKFYYELCCVLFYKYKNNDKGSIAITVIDGNYFSIFPYNNNIYTLTDVQYTVIKKSYNINELYELKDNINEQDIQNIRNGMESKAISYIPNFLDNFEYTDYVLTFKTKFETSGDDRSLRTTIKDNELSLCSGKITGISKLEDILNDFIK